jgi:hypothetical protein
LGAIVETDENSIFVVELLVVVLVKGVVEVVGFSFKVFLFSKINGSKSLLNCETMSEASGKSILKPPIVSIHIFFIKFFLK